MSQSTIEVVVNQLQDRIRLLPHCPWCGRSPNLVRRALSSLNSHVDHVQEMIKIQCPHLLCATSTDEFRTDEQKWRIVQGATSLYDALICQWTNKRVLVPFSVDLPELHYVRSRVPVRANDTLEQDILPDTVLPHELVVAVPYARNIAVHLRTLLDPVILDGRILPFRFKLIERRIEYEASLTAMRYEQSAWSHAKNWSSFTFLCRGSRLTFRSFNRSNVDTAWLKSRPSATPFWKTDASST